MSVCEYRTATHHSDDLVEVFTGRRFPTMLCGFHQANFLVEALNYVGDRDRWLDQSAVDLMIGASNHPIDNKRNALVLRVTKGTPLELYALSAIIRKRRSWVQWHTDRQSLARRKPRRMHTALRYYRTAQPDTPIDTLLTMAAEFIAHREESIRCTK